MIRIYRDEKDYSTYQTVGIGQTPNSDLALVDVLDKFPQLWVVGYHFFQG